MTNASFESGPNLINSNVSNSSKQQCLTRYLKSLSEEVSDVIHEQLRLNILRAPYCESLLLLVGALRNNECANRRDVEVVFELLRELVFEHDHLFGLLSELSAGSPSDEAGLCGDQLVILPDTAASNGVLVDKQFTEKCFYSRLAQVIVEVLEAAASCSVRRDFAALGKVLGRVCKRSHGPSYVMPVLTCYVIRLKSDDYRSRKFVWQLFSAVRNDYLDSVVIAVLNYCPNWKLVSSFLGDLAVERPVCRNLFVDKLVNVKYFESSHFVCNLIGYLVGPETSRQLLLREMCEKLVLLWKDLFVIQYSSFAQLVYINKCVVLAVHRHPSPADLLVLNADIIQGITNYLKSSVGNVKFLGAYVGQLICNEINANTTGKKLDLSCCNEGANQEERNLVKEIENVISLFEKQEKEETSEILMTDSANETVLSLSHATKHLPTNKQHPSSQPKVNASKYRQDSETDSDDDLVPYDMPNDVSRPHFAKAFYLQDVMCNLTGEEASKNPDLFEQTMVDAEKIIDRSEDAAVSELCVEVAKLLLHVENKYSTCGFEGYRVAALTSLLTRQPEKMSSFLIQQFYSSDYSIRHRLDILQTMRNAVLKLSAVGNMPTMEDNPRVLEKEGETNIPEWRRIVDVRVLAKTKFYRSSKVKRDPPTVNKFASVCGSFFFPFLAEFDKPMRTLQLQTEDSQVFSNLLYTLGIITYYSANSPALEKMVQTLLGDFCVNFVRHSDAAVRQSVWFCAVSSALALKPFNVSSEGSNLLKVLLSYRISAAEVVANDPHFECVDLAKHFMSCLNSLLVDDSQS